MCPSRTTPCGCCARPGSPPRSRPSPSKEVARRDRATCASVCAIVSPERIRDELNKLLVSAKPSRGLELVVDTGLAEVFLPELPALRLEQDPVHRHKDVFRHTLGVIERCEAERDPCAWPRCSTTWASRRRGSSPKTACSSTTTRWSARAWPRSGCGPFATPSGRSPRWSSSWRCTCASTPTGWDGPTARFAATCATRATLLDPLNQLVRADCTTRNPFKARALAALQDELEERVARLAEEENLAKIRPPAGRQRGHGPPGPAARPEIGEALDHLLELRMDRGPDRHATRPYALLDAWAAEPAGLRSPGRPPSDADRSPRSSPGPARAALANPDFRWFFIGNAVSPDRAPTCRTPPWRCWCST